MSLQLIFKDETVQDHLHVLIRASFRFTGMSIKSISGWCVAKFDQLGH